MLLTNLSDLCILLMVICPLYGSNQILKPGTSIYDSWKKTDTPRIVKIFIFNWTNPEDIKNADIKPKFEEVGPYIFSEHVEKTNIVWNENNTVTYKELRTWFFEPEKSSSSLDDIVTTVNPIVVQLGEVFRYSNYFFKQTMSMAFRALNAELYVSIPAGQLLFDGYDDPILKTLNQIHSDEDNPIADKFAYFYGVNGSDKLNGFLNVNTGVDGQLGELKSWNFQNITSSYPEGCNSFDGSSAGDFFPDNLTKNHSIKIFADNLCRPLEFEYEKEVNVDGKVGYRYSAGDKFLDNGVKIPENKCFCGGECLPYGVLNVTSCKRGAPAFVSLHHFYKADPSYRNALEGVDVSPDHDDIYIVFDPVTGTPWQFSLGLQLNLHLRPISGMRMFEDLPSIFLPIFYVEELLS